LRAVQGTQDQNRLLLDAVDDDEGRADYHKFARSCDASRPSDARVFGKPVHGSFDRVKLPQRGSRTFASDI
jgi:hypothetical protein